MHAFLHTYLHACMHSCSILFDPFTWIRVLLSNDVTAEFTVRFQLFVDLILNYRLFVADILLTNLNAVRYFHPFRLS